MFIPSVLNADDLTLNVPVNSTLAPYSLETKKVRHALKTHK